MATGWTAEAMSSAASIKGDVRLPTALRAALVKTKRPI
jgi:hypothetical protein